MSSNKGKDGEMRFAILIAKAAQQIDGLDFIRPTITNESDMGADSDKSTSYGNLIST